jgi:hypothetical protein
MQRKLTYDENTSVFTLTTTDRFGTDVQMFTVPSRALYFDVYGVDCAHLQRMVRNHRVKQEVEAAILGPGIGVLLPCQPPKS